MATNRNFIVKQGIEVGTYANAASSWTTDQFISNKNDIQLPPNFTLDFTRGTVDSRIQSYRPSEATTLAANGKLITVSANTPRLEYDLQSRRCLGLLAEESRTNLLLYSDIIGVPGTVPIGMIDPYPVASPVVSTDQWIGPNKQSCKHTRGGVTIDDNVGYMGVGGIVLNTWFTASMYVYIPSSSPITSVYFSLDAGSLTVGAGQPLIATANLSLRDQWQRLSVTTYWSSGSGGAAMVFRVSGSGFNGTGVGNTSIVYTDAWQFEIGEYASTFIPTTNASATRVSEYSYIYPFNQYYNDDGFTVNIEATPKWTCNALMGTITNSMNAGSSRGPFSLDWYNADTGFGFAPYNGYGMVCPQNFGNGLVNLNSRELAVRVPGYWTSGPARSMAAFNTGHGYPNNLVANTIFKAAGVFDKTFSRLVVNGDATTIANNTTSASLWSSNNTITQLRLGIQQQGGAGTIWGGHIRKFSFYPRSLSNNEIISLTET